MNGSARVVNESGPSAAMLRGPQASARRAGLAGALLLLTTLAAGNVSAFPSLNLTTTLPDISSASQIDVTYTYNGGTGIGTLRAMGGASLLKLPPNENIAGGFFDLNAQIDVTNTAIIDGTLSIQGTTTSYPVGPLLTAGTLSEFGAGAGDPLEFVFRNLGGSLAGLFGASAGVILSNTGFSGDLMQSFNSGRDGNNDPTYGASADTFSVVPEPATLALLLLGGVPIVVRRGRTRRG